MLESAIRSYVKDFLNIELTPLFVTELDKTSVCYNLKYLLGGKVKQSQLTLNIISSDYDEVKILEDKFVKLLDIDIQKPSILRDNYVFRSSLAGGGCLFRDDLQMYENNLIFIIKWKEK